MRVTPLVWVSVGLVSLTVSVMLAGDPLDLFPTMPNGPAWPRVSKRFETSTKAASPCPTSRLSMAETCRFVKGPIAD